MSTFDDASTEMITGSGHNCQWVMFCAGLAVSCEAGIISDLHDRSGADESVPGVR